MKRVVSAFLLVVVILGLLPTPAFASSKFSIKDVKGYGRVWTSQEVGLPETHWFVGGNGGEDWSDPLASYFHVAEDYNGAVAVWASPWDGASFDYTPDQKIEGAERVPSWEWDMLDTLNSDWLGSKLNLTLAGNAFDAVLAVMYAAHSELCEECKALGEDWLFSSQGCDFFQSALFSDIHSANNPKSKISLSTVSNAIWNLFSLCGVEGVFPISGQDGQSVSAYLVANKHDADIRDFAKQIQFLRVCFFIPENIDMGNDLRNWEITLKSAGIVSHNKTAEDALKDAVESLGPAPSASASFKERAIWSAKASVIYQHNGATPPTIPVSREEVASSTELTELEKATILSLFDLLNLSPPTSLPSYINIEGGNPPPAIDAVTAAYALKQYNALAAANSLNTDYLRMEAMIYKMQATMGLASGVIHATDSYASENSLTREEIADFESIAYGEAMADVTPLLFADVTSIESPHLGNEVRSKWLYYLVVCYNEFAAYGTTLINVLAPSIMDGQTVFSGYEKDLSALKAMYEAASWVDDNGIWGIWNSKNTRAKEEAGDFTSLKLVYDYLLSVNAFDIIDDYNPESVDGPLKYFFGAVERTDASEGAGWQLSTDMRTGIVASSSFLPMKTNLYDPYTFSNIVETSWLVNFHSKFGYNRKALYIDTNVDAAVNFQRTGTRGELRVCTLEDLLYADKDIVLYLDDNLYNVSTLAELTDKAFNRLDNVDDASSTRSWWQKMGDAIVGIWDVSMENIAKTAESTTYSSKVRNQYKAEENNKWNQFFLSDEVTEEYLTPDDLWDEDKGTVYEEGSGHEASSYTPLTAFAVLSAIYKDPALFNSLNTILNRNTPVFISSPTMPYVENASKDERQSIFNYLLLKNLDSQMSIDYATNLDMTSPVYMDIYGNIVTESGLVVVPAAANATLWNSSYTPYNAAFLSTYGDDFLLEYDEEATELNKVFDGIMAPVDGYWQLTSIKVVGGNVDLSRLSTADKDTMAAITEIFKADLYRPQGIYSKSMWEMIITEVLRGAPIEHIDKDFEGLNLSHRVTKNGLVVAEKLEFLVEALSSKGTNTTLSIPNPAYMDGIEYVVFFAFKILILAILVIWMVTIYVDAVGGGVNLKTGAKCIGAVILVLSLIVGVPAAFELSYYQSNKLLLQEETEYLMMLNLEKSESGQEIGITDIHEPDTNTTLYLKLADVDIPWYDLLPKIITSSTANNLEAMYAEYEGQHPIASAEGVTVINDAVYISTDQLFNSSSISFSPTLKQIWQQASGDTPASYYTPYYYFLEQLINKANTWTSKNEYYSYTTKVQRGGKLKTLGYVQPYFTSEQFMQEGMDYFGLYTLYDVTPPMVYTDELIVMEDDLDAARDSQWCNMNISDQAKIQRIEKLNQYARKWVADHKELLGKVTDETFLKCMALACAMEHNRLFNTLRADNLEIYELSNEDLMRLSIADHDTVMKSSTMSYARFVFTVGGTPAVYAAALLTLVNFLSSWVKPIATLLVFCITCISIFVFKLILRKNNNSIYGYICTILLMCSINVLGSVFLKLSMYIPSTGLSPTVCILVQIVVQCAYLYALLWIIKTALKDWRNVGFERYNTGFNKLTHRQQYSVDVDTPKQKNGWDYYNALVERQRRRHRSL